MRFALVPFALFLLILSGCSPYLSDYYYVPRPALVRVPATQPADPPAATLLAAVIGIRRGDSGKNLPEMIEVRLRLEAGRDPLTLDPRGLDLVSGALLAFPNAQCAPAVPFTLAPNTQGELLALFPLPANTPADSLDLSTLRLRAPLAIAGRPILADITFQKLVPVYLAPYADPWYGPYYDPYFFGGAYHRHWR